MIIVWDSSTSSCCGTTKEGLTSWGTGWVWLRGKAVWGILTKKRHVEWDSGRVSLVPEWLGEKDEVFGGECKLDMGMLFAVKWSDYLRS